MTIGRKFIEMEKMTSAYFDDVVAQVEAICDGRDYSLIHDGWARWSYYANEII